MVIATELAPSVGTALVCRALGVSRAGFYRRQKPPLLPGPAKDRNPSPRALSHAERRNVLGPLNSPQFVDRAPAQVHAALLDQGFYHCSARTMYRILHDNQEVRERRDQLQHPQYHRPELIASGPCQVWSWDITLLPGPGKGSRYHLYVILDIFSRYSVGWLLAHRECSELATRLIRETCDKQGVQPDQLTIHSDRGPAMKSQTVAQLLAALGVVKSHSRPRISNDNPFSESQFKTFKYQPDFPDRFASYDEALAYCTEFFSWYNDHHYHSGLNMLTPASVHYGHDANIVANRRRTLDGAYAAHPERFVRGLPTQKMAPQTVWINPPDTPQLTTADIPEFISHETLNTH
jgi:putative transposase